LPQFLDSLALVEALDIEWVYPGHGDPFTDHRALIQRQSARIAQRAAECYGLIADGAQTFDALFAAMYGVHATADRFSALGMLVGYLDLLEVDGLIKGRMRDGVRTFGVTA
jgi:glyoxylase-like metal-dependent hydrolase (beta-lactamase superfamily II)